MKPTEEERIDEEEEIDEMYSIEPATYRRQPFFLRAEYEPGPKDITVFTQLTIDRFDKLRSLIVTWQVLYLFLV